MAGHIRIRGRTFAIELLPAWKDTAPLLFTQSLSCCTPKNGKAGLRRTGPAKLSSATGTIESPLEFPLGKKSAFGIDLLLCSRVANRKMYKEIIAIYFGLCY